jgi:hypothetical protein
MRLRSTKYPHLSIVVEDLEESVELINKKPNEFDLLGMWYTKDKRIAIVRNVDVNGFMNGVVTRNGIAYEVTWDCDQRSITPFRYTDDLAIKIESDVRES